MDRIGLGYGQFGQGYGQNWIGVWTKLGYPMYSFLYICKESIINSGLDAIPASFSCSFGFIMKWFGFKDIK